MSSPAPVDSAGLGLEGGGQGGLVILEGDVVAQEVGAGEKLNLQAETRREENGGRCSGTERMGRGDMAPTSSLPLRQSADCARRPKGGPKVSRLREGTSL